ncbi:fibroblast growth factor receptor 4-like [Stylophora pistillata]|uniref:fibroblast growth factor receptor 4-like n=1 Tax=Stylophora pistillata TaxID=50429 RepID=UPI000C04945D|nr:fibroblast growth factor receptor 4-like [Stylophora pistillata]
MRLKPYRYLKIKRAKKEDSGFYTCVGVNDCGKNPYALQLLVRDAPIFTVPQYKMRRNLLALPVGNSVKLDCSADGNPRPTVEWYKDRKLFKERKGGRKLYLSQWTTLLSLKDLVPSDTGSYMCIVSNSYGWINHTYELDVHAEPQLRQSSPSRVVKPVGQDEVKLICDVKNAQNYTWYKFDRKIHLPSLRYFVKAPSYLQITDVVKSDSGTFVCVASNDYGRVNCTVRLIVEDPASSSTNVSGAKKPQFLYPDRMAMINSQYTRGDKFQLICDAIGTPVPTVTWYKGKYIYLGHGSDETITPERYDYVITFNKVDIMDRGNYTCVVKNAYGHLTHSYVFDVQEKIESPLLYLHIWKQEESIQYAGTDLQLHCVALSKDNKTKLRWYFSNSTSNPSTLINRTLFESHQKTTSNGDGSWLIFHDLNLKHISVADSGSYSCKAENVVGNVERQTYLNVTTSRIAPSQPAPFGCDLNRSMCSSMPYKIDEFSSTNEHGSTFSPDKDHSFYYIGNEEKTSDVLVPGIVSAFCWCRQSLTKKSVHNPVSKDEFEYDAFIIFSSQDSDWVTKTLIPILEEKHHFKCCVHYRDFVLGVPFRENMVNSVYKSRKTIAVVSINFFNSNYCGSEMDYALHRLMERRDDSLVVIKLDDVDRGKLPKELRKRSYIDYQKNVEKDHWERKLVNCLKYPNDLFKETIL